MTAYNIVRFKLKPGKGEAFLDAHRNAPPMAGLIEAALINTGTDAYCFVGKWDKFESIAGARPQMISMLDKFRPLLEDMGNGLGLTDPVSGTVALELK
ncbi:DUF718 domain-containing protein [Aestuariivirga litoralis]|uniref:DUF718 domain-containing protein n=1 Tax=Aestuariivirga litoralis TaxID=2650924 RepID=UPI0018C48284|nr:DUF718 domain-containing protein [Aestuariivirga litoralis]MBG1232667.1 DUF718 domain-containing protein [Aestuariivirga litoralis]